MQLKAYLSFNVRVRCPLNSENYKLGVYCLSYKRTANIAATHFMLVVKIQFLYWPARKLKSLLSIREKDISQALFRNAVYKEEFLIYECSQRNSLVFSAVKRDIDRNVSSHTPQAFDSPKLHQKKAKTSAATTGSSKQGQI
uniref:Uncharacterized protein n=1 Tax=Glossina pallidipes TaxID=7398 RepID=A0A1A9ZAJ0_GLOPL